MILLFLSGFIDVVVNIIIGFDIMKFLVVLYYKKGNKKYGIIKKGDRKYIIIFKKYWKYNIEYVFKVIDKCDKDDDGGRCDVVFFSCLLDYLLIKFLFNFLIISYFFFDYKSNYRNWFFLYFEEYFVYM